MNHLPEFFTLLSEAHDAQKAVDYFDLNATNRAEYEQLEREQRDAVTALVEFVKVNGDAVVAALKADENAAD